MSRMVARFFILSVFAGLTVGALFLTPRGALAQQDVASQLTGHEQTWPVRAGAIGINVRGTHGGMRRTSARILGGGRVQATTPAPPGVPLCIVVGGMGTRLRAGFTGGPRTSCTFVLPEDHSCMPQRVMPSPSL